VVRKKKEERKKSSVAVRKMADGADGMADYNGEAKIILAKLRLYWRRLMLIIKVYYLSAAKKRVCDGRCNK
jgi:hypothetical protein